VSWRALPAGWFVPPGGAFACARPGSGVPVWAFGLARCYAWRRGPRETVPVRICDLAVARSGTTNKANGE